MNMYCFNSGSDQCNNVGESCDATNWDRRIACLCIITTDNRFMKFVQCHFQLVSKEKKERSDSVLWQKAPTPTEKSTKQRDNIKTLPKTSITQRLRTDLGRSVK